MLNTHSDTLKCTVLILVAKSRRGAKKSSNMDRKSKNHVLVE